ncbi:MAG: CvpA family protein [Syntrophomonadaceae bacterium]
MGLNVLDYLIVIILALSLVSGNVQGLAAAAGGIVTTVVSLAVAYLYRNRAIDYLEEQYGLITCLTGRVERGMGLPADRTDLDPIIQALPLDNILVVLHGQITEFTYLVVSVIGFLLLYMVSSLLLRMIFVITRLVGHGMGGHANRLGGMALVGAQNFVVLAALISILEKPIGLAAQIGLRNAGQLQVWMGDSVLVPYLMRSWRFLWSLISTVV